LSLLEIIFISTLLVLLTSGIINLYYYLMHGFSYLSIDFSKYKKLIKRTLSRKIKMEQWYFLRPLFIILKALAISTVLTYFIYVFYPFEPNILNFIFIIGSFFNVFISYYFLRKIFKENK